MSWGKIAERQKERNEKSLEAASNKDGDLFMKTTGGGKFNIRFVGDVEEINTLWYPAKGGKKYIVPLNYVEKLRSLGFSVRTQMVCNVIDRGDSKLRFKLLEKGMQVFGPVLTRFNEVLDDDGRKIHPGGPNGDDWSMNVIVPEDARNTSYEMCNLKPTQLTSEEIALGKRKRDPEKYKHLPIGERGLIPISEIYNPERYIEALDKLIAEKEGEMGETDSLEDMGSVKEDSSLDDMSFDLTTTGSKDSDDDSDDLDKLF